MYSQMLKRVSNAVVYTKKGELELMQVEGYAFKAKGDLSEPVYEYHTDKGDIIELREAVTTGSFVAYMSEKTFDAICKPSRSRVQGALNRSTETGFKVTGDYLNLKTMKVEKGVTKEGVKASDLRFWKNVTAKKQEVAGWNYVLPYTFVDNAERTFSDVETMLSTFKAEGKKVQ